MKLVHYLILLIPLAIGCGTIAAHDAGVRMPYAGVRLDAQCLVAGWALGHDMSDYTPALLISPIAIADMPLSAVADTFCLPYTLTHANKVSTAHVARTANSAATANK